MAATEVALQALTQWDGAEVTVTQPRGYPEQRFGSWSFHPMTEVDKDGEAVALVYLAGDDEQAPASAPWTQAPQVDVCRSFLNDEGLLRAATRRARPRLAERLQSCSLLSRGTRKGSHR